tara:strand:- start:14 stop:454 length:441 start_codon:yes stop_codon:yes gene_type:complete
MPKIKPTLSITANKGTHGTTPGPLPTSIAISATKELTVDKVEIEIWTSTGSGNSVLIDGSDYKGSAVGGTDGSFIYLKNITASGTEKIYIGHGGNGDVAADSALRLMTLMPGEFAFFPYDYTTDIIVDASASAQKLEVWRYNRSTT